MQSKKVSEQTRQIRENAEKEIPALEKKIAKFSKIAWRLMGGGFISTAFCFILLVKGYLKLNEIGDFLTGTTGILWALSGIFFIYVAFLGQKQQLLYQSLEIHLNREELELTREELAGQREALQEQSYTFKLQQFENTFFQLLALQMQIHDSIDTDEKLSKTGGIPVRGGDNFIVTHKGSDAFKLLYIGLRFRLRDATTIKQIREIYSSFFKEYQSDLGHYFRNLYRIIKFIDQSNLRFEEKYSYTSIVRAQISAFELAFLFYNCLSPLGDKKFKPFIEKYALLKNFPISELAMEKHKRFYAQNAYGFERTKSSTQLPN